MTDQDPTSPYEPPAAASQPTPSTPAADDATAEHSGACGLDPSARYDACARRCCYYARATEPLETRSAAADDANAEYSGPCGPGARYDACAQRRCYCTCRQRARYAASRCRRTRERTTAPIAD